MLIQKIRESIDSRMNSFLIEKKDISVKRKIVVIESDDWGSIRMPSREVLEKLKHRFQFHKCNYCSYDSILTNEDLDFLCEVLLNYKDRQGNNPIITTNFVTANPDFQKIKESNFLKYYNESILNTIQKYPNVSFDRYRQAINSDLFRPQLHGREHLNVNRWMKQLQLKNSDFLIGFDNELFGLSTSVTKSKCKSVMAALDLDSEGESLCQEEIIIDAVRRFRDLFGFYPQSFIAPNYIWNENVENVLSQNGIKYLQGSRIQKVPLNSKKRKFHYIGEKNCFGQLYLVRNVFFEPSTKHGIDWVDRCMSEVKKAFKHNVPAIISSHRVTFCGRIDKSNRDVSLRQLSMLLNRILHFWPDVEFMSSDELGETIGHERK